MLNYTFTPQPNRSPICASVATAVAADWVHYRLYKTFPKFSAQSAWIAGYIANNQQSNCSTGCTHYSTCYGSYQVGLVPESVWPTPKRCNTVIPKPYPKTYKTDFLTIKTIDELVTKLQNKHSFVTSVRINPSIRGNKPNNINLIGLPHAWALVDYNPNTQLIFGIDPYGMNFSRWITIEAAERFMSIDKWMSGFSAVEQVL